MSVKVSLERVKIAAYQGISPTVDALEDLIDDLDDFLALVEDYDEWDAMYYKGSQEPEPGFSLGKLRMALGYDKEGR